MDLITLLRERGVLSERDEAALQEEMRTTKDPLEKVLARHGVSERDTLLAKGAYWNIPVYELGTSSVPFETLSYIPGDSAQHYKAVPLGLEDSVLKVGVVDPDNIEALDALNFIAAKKNVTFKIFLISETDFQNILKSYQGVSGDVTEALTALNSSGLGDATDEDDAKQPEVTLDVESRSSDQLDHDVREDAPITKIVATLLRSAVDGRASDVHIEPGPNQLRVRFRVDGELHTSITLPTKVARAVAARVKVLSGIKLDERRRPQDGRFSAKIAERRIDFRVSTFPTTYGEKVVLRILDQEKGVADLTSVGLVDWQMDIVRAAISKPYGLILITGPTGSGKSTSLYSMLQEVERTKMNVVSLEDPVEYDIDGVSQSQVRPEIGYTFASGLRSILRQDPDIIMVGEIRDKETAQLAVQAALTGHLVFSTLHTNNATGAVPRLIDMGVDPYLLAPTLELVIGQRLVRKLCVGVGRPIPIMGKLKEQINKQFSDLPPEFHHLVPNVTEVLGIEATGSCPTGTRGRTGVFEFMPITQELEQAILESADDRRIYEIARAHGMLTMREDALLKAFRKEIPIEEVNQLGGDDIFGEDISVEEKELESLDM